MKECFCGSHRSFENCCNRFISGQVKPQTPEELMRSRYSAYTIGDLEFIAETMKEPASHGFNKESAEQQSKQMHWLALEIKNTKTEGNKGIVEFIAHYSADNKKYSLHEVSEFSREDNTWYYVNGKIIPEPALKISRNETCPCGSAKKYKKCCGNY